MTDAPFADGCRCAWPKTDSLGLARFVYPAEAASTVVLASSGYDVIQGADGRRAVAELVYRAFSSLGIRYALEEWNPDERCQTIRSPEQVVVAPRRGTCLDLAVLFAGACLEYDLLPIVAVTQRHALVLVSLQHGPRQWRAFERQESSLFEAGPVTDSTVIGDLLSDGRYIAIETTGFSASDSLPDDSLEGGGRKDGLLPFDQAVAAGHGRFSLADDPLRFALDIAAAHAMGVAPQRICSHEPMVASDHAIITFGPLGARAERPTSADAPILRERPVRRLRRRAPVLVGHDEEKTLLKTALAGEFVGLHGESGLGKTALLRWLGFELSPELPDGPVYVHGREAGGLDLIQAMFDSFYENTGNHQITWNSAAEYLGEKRALFLVDDVEVDAGELTSVLDVVTNSGLAATANGADSLVYGTTLPVRPLDPAEAFELLERECGQIDLSEDVDRIDQLWAKLGTKPVAIIGFAKKLMAGETTIAAALADPEGPAEPSPDLIKGRAAEILRTAFPASVHRVHLQTMLGDIDDELQALLDDSLIESGSPRFRWSGPISAAASKEAASELITHMTQWAGEAATADQVVADRCLVLRAIELADGEGRHDDLISLTRSTESWLAVGNRWDAWNEVLHAAEGAAIQSGDASSQAWVLHQRGTRELALGNDAAAADLLEAALERREGLGDKEAAELTRHNLELIRPPAVPWWRRTLANARRGGWLRGVAGLAIALIGLVFAAVVVCAIVGCGDETIVVGPDEGATPTAIPLDLARFDLEPGEFGTVTVGLDAELALTVNNAGDGSASFSPTIVNGSNVFTVDTSRCADVTPGGSCEFIVGFAPDRSGTHELVLGFDGKEKLAAAGFGATPGQLELTGSGEFETLVLSSSAESRLTFVVGNRGERPLEVAAIEVSRPDTRVSISLIGSVACEVSLGSEQTCEFDVSFTSEAATSFKSTLRVRSADGQMQEVDLFGEARIGGVAAVALVTDGLIRELNRSLTSIDDWMKLGASAEILPELLEFSSAPAEITFEMGNTIFGGDASLAFLSGLVVLENRGDEPLRIEGIDGSSEAFLFATNCVGVELAAASESDGDTCRIVVAFDENSAVGASNELTLQVRYASGSFGPTTLVLAATLVTILWAPVWQSPTTVGFLNRMSVWDDGNSGDLH